MNTILLYALAIAALAVVVAGAFLLLVSIICGILDIWSRISACGKNTREYLRNRSDFTLYQRDMVYWEEAKRHQIDRCRTCSYLEQVLKEEANHDE